jgi:hypothetical protein
VLSLYKGHVIPFLCNGCTCSIQRVGCEAISILKPIESDEGLSDPVVNQGITFFSPVG